MASLTTSRARKWRKGEEAQEYKAGESATDPTIRVAQQGAGIQRVKMANAAFKAPPLPITKGMQVTARENHIHYTETISKKRKAQRVYGYRVFEGEGVVRTIEDGLCKVEVGGQLRVVRIEQLIAVPCRALVVYEKPPRPAVNVLPPGTEPMILEGKIRRYDYWWQEWRYEQPNKIFTARYPAHVLNAAVCKAVPEFYGGAALGAGRWLRDPNERAAYFGRWSYGRQKR